MKILSFGEIIWDVYPEHRVIGGAPLNFAGHCAMGGLESYMLSAVGQDDLAAPAMQALERFGVKGDFVTANDRKTGQCIVTLNEKGIPSYQVLTDVAYDQIQADPQVIAAQGFDAFYFGTLAQRCRASRETLNKLLRDCSFGEIFCDLNLRNDCYDEESVQNCLSHATILKFSDEEAPRLEIYAFWKALRQGDLMQNIFRAYPQIKVILFTKGKDGAAVYTADGAHYEVPAVGDKVASTVGAGDSFGAAWLSRYLSGDDALTAAKIASRVSGFVVSVVEALPKYNIADFI